MNRNFPKAIAKVVLLDNGTMKRTKVDSSRTEEGFGFEFQSYE